MNFALLADPEYWLVLLKGIPVTLSLTIASVIFGTLIAVPIALMRTSSLVLLQSLASGCVFLFRGVPILLLLLFIYYGLPQAKILRDRWFWDIVVARAHACIILAISLSNGSHVGKVFRGGLLAVPRRGGEAAARLIGMRRLQTMARKTLRMRCARPCSPTATRSSSPSRRPRWASIITIYDVLAQTNLTQEVTADQLTLFLEQPRLCRPRARRGSLYPRHRPSLNQLLARKSDGPPSGDTLANTRHRKNLQERNGK
ncbi:ABC transporter permease subunit [Sinorhizobium medicae]|nr:ABC transporter permease subunit [Sinorhizobium medicae]MDX1244534.1 ABC transporter permease subunit [Sinorhizobium medicae]